MYPTSCKYSGSRGLSKLKPASDEDSLLIATSWGVEPVGWVALKTPLCLPYLYGYLEVLILIWAPSSQDFYKESNPLVIRAEREGVHWNCA